MIKTWLIIDPDTIGSGPYFGAEQDLATMNRMSPDAARFVGANALLKWQSWQSDRLDCCVVMGINASSSSFYQCSTRPECMEIGVKENALVETDIKTMRDLRNLLAAQRKILGDKKSRAEAEYQEVWLSQIPTHGVIGVFYDHDMLEAALANPGGQTAAHGDPSTMHDNGKALQDFVDNLQPYSYLQRSKEWRDLPLIPINVHNAQNRGYMMEDHKWEQPTNAQHLSDRIWTKARIYDRGNR
jgi:hypothetical protein